MRKVVPVLFIILLGFGLTNATAQDVVKLWEGQAKPFYKENSLVEKEQTTDGVTILSDITEPTLTIYPAQGKNSGVAVVVIPGGGYSIVAIKHEGHDIAKALSERGITAAVLKYRLPNPKSSPEPEKVPLSDARRALKILHQQAEKYGINKSLIGVSGFSAGSHLSTVASLWKSSDPDENPAFSGLIYGVTKISGDTQKWLEDNLYFRKMTAEEQTQNRLLDRVDKTTPPAFLVHAYDDTTCNVEQSLLYAQKLRENNVPVEMHLFPTGGHGFGPGKKEDGTDQWVPLFAAWLLRLDSKSGK